MAAFSRFRRRWSFPLLATITLVALGLLALATVRDAGASGATARASTTKTVSVVSFAYKPGTLHVKRGGSVTFANHANTAHTATGAGFDTKRISPGKSKTVHLTHKGTFSYHCTIHPFMKGKIVVD